MIWIESKVFVLWGLTLQGPGDVFLDRFSRGSGVTCSSNWPANDQVICPVPNGLVWCHDTLLVIVVLDRAYTRADSYQAGLDVLSQGADFQSGRHDAIATKRQRSLGA
jgi:hypothetical protein